MIPVTPGTIGAAETATGKALDAVRKVGGIKKGWESLGDNLGFGSDHESVPYWMQQRASKKYWQDHSTDAYDAYLLNQSSGLGDETSIMRRLRKAGLIDAEGNVIAPEGYDPSGFDPNNPDSADRNRLMRALKGPDSRPSMLRKGFDEYRADLARKKIDDFKKSTIDPLTKTVTERINEMLANPMITPEEMATMRSEAVSQARAQEAQRLTRVGATLGLRGIDPGSVAGAALLAKIGEDTDRQITEGLRRFGLDVAELERGSEMSENEAALNWGTKMAQLETALTSGNLDQVFQINSELAAMSEAISARDEALKAQKEANRNNLYAGYAGAAGDAIGGIF